MGKLGMRKHTGHRTNVARDRMWKGMRHLRVFTSAQIESVAEASKDNVGRYISALADAGYLVCTQAKQSGLAGGHAVWQLIKNTGPVAPRLGLDGVFDANLADPFTMSYSKRIAKHGPAMLKALREIVDAVDCADPAMLKVRIDAGRAVLEKHDGGLS